MIGVLGIPVVNRPDLLAACLASIDEPIGRLVIVDNAPEGGMAAVAEASAPGLVEDLCVTRPPANLGFAASLNLVMRTHPREPWWALANADVIFGPGDLGRLAGAMTSERCLRVCGDWRLFGIGADVLQRVGLWDENYHPVYVEDCDWEHRCRIAGVAIEDLPGSTSHEGSVCYRSDPRNARHLARTFPSNVAYHEAKWGGHPRGGERYTTPFDRGGSLADWTLDLRRIRDNDWR